MATPHLAGSAAVVLGQHPSWPAWAVRSAVVNTADENVLKTSDGTCCDTDVNDVGSGRENLSSAVGASLAFDPVSVSFGASAVRFGPDAIDECYRHERDLGHARCARPIDHGHDRLGRGVLGQWRPVLHLGRRDGDGHGGDVGGQGCEPGAHQAILRFGGLAHAALFTWIK